MLMGPKVSVFGMEIDGIEFDNNFGMDQKSPKSYQGMWYLTSEYHAGRQTMTAHLPPNKVEAKRLAEQYFMGVGPFAPVLDKRDMDRLVSHRMCSLLQSELTIYIFFIPAGPNIR
jgi:hypothetical protein